MLCHRTATANPLAFIVKDKTDDRMIKEFLLHKDIKENGKPPHIQAHLSLPDTKANASQSQKSLHFVDAEIRTKIDFAVEEKIYKNKKC